MAEPRDHGPLPALLAGLSLVTGLVDSYSYLVLGHVFVANMTGNVVFLGFGLARVGGISLTAVLLALLAFAAGAALGGRWGASRAQHRGLLLALGTATQAVLLLVAAVLASAAGGSGVSGVSGASGVSGRTVRLVLVGLLAVAMGIQNAVVRRLAVPDMATTVLTMTVTGLFADSVPRQVRLRRIAGLAAMLAGAVLGGILLHWVSVPAPLWSAATVLTGAATAAQVLARRSGSAAAWG
jgi:uncharacterized membrane protein YoaK (UPF0700 family)